MLEAGVIGIARVVMHTKERLAALIPDREALMLNTIRWSAELRSRDGMDLPAAGKGQLKEGELKMARQLIGDMTSPWKPEAFEDKFTAAIHALAASRVEAGKTEKVTPVEEAAPEAASNVVDLTELLRRSLDTRKPSATAKKTGGANGSSRSAGARPAPAKAAANKTAAKKAGAAKKVSQKRAA
jgi:DNA end-binding protein Ku